MSSASRPGAGARRRRDPWAALPTEALDDEAADLDALPAEAIVGLLTRRERRSVAAVERAAGPIARAAELAARAVASGGRIVYVGAGTSGRLGALDAAECPPTFGTRPGQVVAVVAGGARALRRSIEGAEDRGADARRALARLGVGPRDVVVGVAASGLTPFARAGLAAARAAGARTVFVTSAPWAARGVAADVVVPLEVGPEVLAGSTRLGAGTATKMALNAISTTAMVRAGRAWGPRMVDLRASSAKLRARARRILAETAGVDGAAADRLLRAAGGRVKVAIVMALRRVGRREAERALRAAGGRLRDVVGPPPRRRAEGGRGRASARSR